MDYQRSPSFCVDLSVEKDRGTPSRSRSRPWTARTSVTLGMPQLDGCGLSETWLQKTCGEVHWRGLAARLGRPAEQWIDSTGQRVYAAFGIVRLQWLRLGVAQEGKRLRLESQLSPLGRSQAWSRHRLSIDADAIGQLEMLSIFVGRGEDGSNRSVRRVAMSHQATHTVPAAARKLADRARDWRTAAASAYIDPAVPPYSLRFMPCPRGDFNGAGLIYFATFTAWADWALFSWKLLSVQDRVIERECLFLGNLDVGNEVEIVLHSSIATSTELSLEVDIRCKQYGRLLARVRTILTKFIDYSIN